ncbi:MAG: magnesium transporter, partial [Chloroflexi bacterium]|nr:magnesium transporter [Chloroflexota bacterium]
MDTERVEIGRGVSMLFVAQLFGLTVHSHDGARIGRLHDILVRIEDREFPGINGLVIQDRGRLFFMPAHVVSEISYTRIEINTTKINLQQFRRRDGEVLLSKDVIDHQIIDINGRRVVRVNDVQIAQIEHEYCVIGVDISPQALLRRIAPRTFAPHVIGRQIISWADAQYLASAAPVQLKVSYNRLAEINAVDLARIVDALSYKESAEIVAALDDETAAETLEEVSDERVIDLLEGMDQERAADILEEMTPSAAADLLEDLGDEIAAQLLERMEPEEAEDVKELLAYDGDTVGRSMTTDIVLVYAHERVHAVIEKLRLRDELPDPFTEVYVVTSSDDSIGEPELTQQFVGVVPLHKLMLSSQQSMISELMVEVPVIDADAPAESAARVLGEYNLTAIPVVDEHHGLLGAVTVDDALAVLLPDIWTRRGTR